jgi:hypothetical protein
LKIVRNQLASKYFEKQTIFYIMTVIIVPTLKLLSEENDDPENTISYSDYLISENNVIKIYEFNRLKKGFFLRRDFIRGIRKEFYC